MDIALLIQVITLVILILGFAVSIFQIVLLRRQIREEHEWNRRQNSLGYSFSTDPVIRDIRSKLDKFLFTRSRKPGEITLKEIQDSSTEYPDIYTDIDVVLGRLELMCVAMQNGIADEQTCKDLLRGTVIRYYRLFGQYIEDTRKQYDNPKLYIGIQNYTTKWLAEENHFEIRKRTGV